MEEALARNVNSSTVRTAGLRRSWHFLEQTEDAEGIPCRLICRGRISGAGNLPPAYSFFCSGKRGGEILSCTERPCNTCADLCGG